MHSDDEVDVDCDSCKADAADYGLESLMDACNRKRRRSPQASVCNQEKETWWDERF